MKNLLLYKSNTFQIKFFSALIFICLSQFSSAQNVHVLCIGNTLNLTTPNSTWNSSNSLVATVDNSGNISAISSGICVISTLDINLNTSSTDTIKVNSDIVTPLVSQDSVCVDGIIHIKSTQFDGVWASSNPSVAVISNGIITGVSVGSTTISYTVCGVINTKVISVYLANPPTLTLITSTATLHQMLTPDFFANDTAYYVPMDTVRFQIGGGATGAYIVTGASGLPHGVTATFSNGFFTICGTPYLTFPFPTGNSTYSYSVFTTGGSHCISDPAEGDTVYYDTTGTDGGYIADIILTPPCVNQISGPNFIPVCMNDYGTATYTITGSPTGVVNNGLPPGFSGSYSNGAYTISYGGVAPGTYSFELTTVGGNCFQTKSYVDVEIYESYILMQYSQIGKENQTVCVNESIDEINYGTYQSWGTPPTIFCNDALPNGITAIFTNGHLIFSGTPTESGVFPYTVYIVGGYCTYGYMTGTITVNALPEIESICAPAIICQNTALTLSNITTNGVWTSDDTSILIDPTTGELNTSIVGTTQITYTVTIGNCSNSVSTSIEIQATPVLSPIISISSICVGESVLLSDGSETGTWISSDETIATVDQLGNILGISEGSVIFTNTVSNGICSNFQDISIQVHGIPLVTYGITGPTSGCINTTVQLYTMNTGGVWSSVSETIATVNQNGRILCMSAGSSEIRYTVTNGFCPVYTSIIFTVLPLPIVDFTTTLNNNTVSFTNNSSNINMGYTWDFGDATTASSEENPTHTFIENGTYTITLFGENECGIDSMKYTFGIGETLELNPINYTVYPNPFSNEIKVSFSTVGEREISVMDVTGKIIFREISSKDGVRINLESLSFGQYLLKVKEDSKVTIKKITKF
jgi:uncharacterized protein YjdB